MLFRVRKDVKMNGVQYKRGDVAEVPEGHPRLEALVQITRHLEYDAAVSEDDLHTRWDGTPVEVVSNAD